MKKNVGKIDRIVRAILGVGFVVLSFAVSYWFLIPAVIMIATAIMGVCGLYSLFGINTCKVKNTPNK
ncbi:MAG: DUF2892 domain-containing protein [Firmicutes bacterium]|nr:DUF2892 domain-containing protein [Bacillota bacterium]